MKRFRMLWLRLLHGKIIESRRGRNAGVYHLFADGSTFWEMSNTFVDVSEILFYSPRSWQLVGTRKSQTGTATRFWGTYAEAMEEVKRYGTITFVDSILATIAFSHREQDHE